MKEKINKRNVSKNNTYKCDMNEPYRFADANLLPSILGTIIFVVIFGGLFTMIFLTQPFTSKDYLPKIIALIIIAFLGLPFIIIGIYSCIKMAHERAKLIKILVDSIILTGTVVSLKMEPTIKRAYRIGVKIDGNNEVISVTSKSKHFWLTRKVAITKNNEEAFILTKCTLLEK